MKALYYNEQKGYQAIKVGEFPIPEINDNEVLVRVKAFSLNHLDVWVMSGSYPVTIPLPHIFGSDASGIVEQAGKAVTHLKAGDEVVVHPGLSCGHCAACLGGRDNECNEFSVLGVVTPGVSAEYVKVPAGNLFPKPAGLSFEEAAGIGVTYTTAWNSLVLRAGIRQGETVLVQAAGSGAGTAVIQVAKLFNATVITTVGDDWKAAKAKELGADLVINHRQEDFLEAVKRFTDGKLVDIAVDHVGADTLHAVDSSGKARRPHRHLRRNERRRSEALPPAGVRQEPHDPWRLCGPQGSGAAVSAALPAEAPDRRGLGVLLRGSPPGLRKTAVPPVLRQDRRARLIFPVLSTRLRLTDPDNYLADTARL